MAHRTTLRLAAIVALAVLTTLSAAAPVGAASAKPIHRSLQELVRAQGTLCVPDGAGGCLLFNPPVANYIFFGAAATERIAAVDYAGLEDRWLQQASGGSQSFHTGFSGTVTERPLGDGRAEVSILLHTRHEVARVFLFDGTLIFGNTTPDVLAGAQPAFGESTFDFVFINPTVGMALPDLGQIVFAANPGQVFVSSHFRAVATGPLHAAFGVSEGTRGQMMVDMISTASNPSVREIITLKALQDE